ncbi:Fe-S cluster assembly factor, chloroplastic [Capsicum chinense]|nr:Fe-S cluster assembly factor, chloroplastic [Capsicum chinense]
MVSNSTSGTSATEATPNVPVPVVLPYAKSFPDVSNIERFANKNFKRWQERIFSLLDVHGVVYALTQTQPDADVDGKILKSWQYTNKNAEKKIIIPTEYMDVKLVSFEFAGQGRAIMRGPMVSG